MAADAGDDEEVDSEEEQVEREWHIWVVALLVVGGLGLVVAPEGMVPGLIGGLGPVFIILGVVGWVTKQAIQRWG